MFPNVPNWGNYKQLGVGSHAIAKGPVLLRYLDEVDDHVLTAQAQPLVQTVGDGLVEALLLLDRAARIQRELDEDAVFGARNAEIVLVSNMVLGRVLADDLETVIQRRVQDVHDG